MVVIFVVREELSLSHGPGVVLIALWGFIFAQVILLGAWVGLGRSFVVVRFLFSMSGILALSWLLSLLGNGKNEQSLWAAHCTVQATIVAVPLFLLRWRGFRLVNPAFDNIDRSTPGGLNEVSCRSPGQYSLFQLMAWVTAMAILLGIGKRVGILKIGALDDLLFEVFVWGGGFGLIGLAAVWTVFHQSIAWWIRMPLMVVLPVILGPIIFRLTFDFWWEPMFIGLTYLVATLVLIALFNCRMCGYRVERAVIIN